MVVLEIRGLLKKYDNVIALSDFSFIYDKLSSVIVLIGPNGAGKTTLLRILAGQIRPTKGYVRILGYDLVKEVDKVVNFVSFLPQDVRAPYYNLTPLDYIVSYLLIRGYSLRDAKRRAREMLELFSLEEYASTSVSRLSGGMVRRALIAAVLSDENARIFLLDEPLPGLDARSRVIFWTAIREVVGRERLAIVSSHYTEDIPLVADYVVVLSRGRKVAEGDPGDIIKSVLGNCNYKVIVKLNSHINGKDLDNYLPPKNLNAETICLDIKLQKLTRIIYTSDPHYIVKIIKNYDIDVEVAPVGLGDIVLALGEME